MDNNAKTINISNTGRGILHLETMTRFEAEEALRVENLAILPVGATEQHGPHLPLGTDTFMATELANRLARRVGGVVLPALSISYSWVWRDNPGTITLKMETFQAVIKDIVHSLDHFDVRRLAIISGHGANDGPLKYVVRDLKDEVRMDVIYFVYPRIAETAARLSESLVWGGMFHACEVETSMLQAVRPDLCRMDRAVREYPPIPARYGCGALAIGNLSKSGIFGDPTLANPGKGEQYLSAWVDAMVEIIEALRREEGCRNRHV